MLTPMYSLVFASVLVVTLATPALAHDETGACDEDHAKVAHQPAGPGALKPGAVLTRGEPLPKNQSPQPLSAVLAKPEDGKKVLVEGVVRRACSQMGCWMELAPPEGGPGVRVTFKDYGFFVPTDSAGAQARVAGTLKVSTLTPDEVAHLRSEGAQVKKGGKEIQLEATGVELRRL